MIFSSAPNFMSTFNKKKMRLSPGTVKTPRRIVERTTGQGGDEPIPGPRGPDTWAAGRYGPGRTHQPRTPPRVGPQLTVVRRVANITHPDKYFYRAWSKYFCSDRSVLSMCGMWSGSAGWVIGAMKQRRIILVAKWTLVNIFCGPRGEGDDSQELKICQNGFCFKFCDFNISHC